MLILFFRQRLTDMKKDKKTEKQKTKLKPKSNLSKYLPAVLLGFNIVMVLTNILVLSLLPRQAEANIITRSEILVHKLQQQSALKLEVDLENSIEEGTIIFQALPNKSRLLEVIRMLESLSEIVNVKNFAFDSDTPIKDRNGFAFLPISLSLNGSLQQVMTALSKLEQAPFLFTINQTILESPEGISQTIGLRIYMRLYVNETFAEN